MGDMASMRRIRLIFFCQIRNHLKAKYEAEKKYFQHQNDVAIVCDTTYMTPPLNEERLEIFTCRLF